jgi:hypothetical protein
MMPFSKLGRNRLRSGLLRSGFLAVTVAVAGTVAAAPYDFVPAPQTDLNRVYRIDRVTGEVSSCQYGLQEGTAGATLCYGAGEGAGAQTPGEYGLVASRHEREGGVFRVNYRTGEMSICYVFDEKVVCTPQTNPSTSSSTGPSNPSASTSQPAPVPSIRTGTGVSPQRP